MAGLLHPPMLSCSCKPCAVQQEVYSKRKSILFPRTTTCVLGQWFFIIIFSHRAEACEVMAAAFLISKFWTK